MRIKRLKHSITLTLRSSRYNECTPFHTLSTISTATNDTPLFCVLYLNQRDLLQMSINFINFAYKLLKFWNTTDLSIGIIRQKSFKQQILIILIIYEIKTPSSHLSFIVWHLWHSIFVQNKSWSLIIDAHHNSNDMCYNFCPNFYNFVFSYILIQYGISAKVI